MEDFLAINWNASDVEWFKDLQVRPERIFKYKYQLDKANDRNTCGLPKGSASIKLETKFSLQSNIQEIRWSF